MPMYISPLILAAYGIFIVYDTMKSKDKKILGMVFYLIIFISSLNLILQSVVINRMFTLKDTRYLSYKFCIGHGISEANTIYEKYTPFAPSKYVDLNRIFHQYKKQRNYNQAL